ncbi:MAG TPA: hypothetical protein DEH78_08295, partial [Solibacterales bacterium]|nr:hypothetical protein [Bryobacterales bacterium]
YANDTASGAQAALPPRVFPAGIYLIAITAAGYEPAAGGAPIFPPIDYFTVFPEDVRDAGTGAALTRWTGFYSLLDLPASYEIDLTGAEFIAIPEPGTIALLCGGLLLFARRRCARWALPAAILALAAAA